MDNVDAMELIHGWKVLIHAFLAQIWLKCVRNANQQAVALNA